MMTRSPLAIQQAYNSAIRNIEIPRRAGPISGTFLLLASLSAMGCGSGLHLSAMGASSGNPETHADLAMQVRPTAPQVTSGGTASLLTVAANSTDSQSGAVTITAIQLPVGVVLSPSTASVTLGSTVNFTIVATANAASGPTTMTLEAKSGDISQSLTVPVTILPAVPISVPSAYKVSVVLKEGSAGEVFPEFPGLSYEKDKMTTPFFTTSNKALVNLFRMLGPGVLSLGGDSVDKVFWNAEGGGGVYHNVAPADIDALAGFLRATQWRVIYGVNFGQSMPAAAAAEAGYAAKSLGDRLLAINIGNEPDSYHGVYKPADWDFQGFIVDWESFANAVVAAVPNVMLAGPSLAGNTSWFRSFAALQVDSVGILTHHYYRGSGTSAKATIPFLLSYEDTSLASTILEIEPAANSAHLPLRINETNSFYSGGTNGVSNSYASALWVLDQSFTLAQDGVVGFNLHGGGTGYYTPIEDSGGKVTAVRPEFYGLLMFTLVGSGTMAPSQISTGEHNFSSYAVKGANGSMRIMLVNKEQFPAMVSLDPGQTVETATALSMSNPSLDAMSGTTIGGTSIETTGQLAGTLATVDLPVNRQSGAALSLEVPAYTAIMIQIK